ncbi:5-oxoprolinase subunit PxpB [Nocardioides sp. HDW12B]|uniref:5-oxoprolinase subunit PxpB n=1 Tax=Nocardioides sp. HDW12B TaxID=2714939 RepID=UPI00140CDDE7|nr:5-oxoprolinase subunit PxpB [Nocardioides sp. HDW12B]QIK66795.1 5-oxoprolinase subunit PxpB [Nocardioides sp. HDW12B]
MRWLPAGPHGLLLELGSTAEVTAAYAGLDPVCRELAGDVVPAARTIFFDDVTDLDRLRELVGGGLDRVGGPAATGDSDAGEVEVPVRYDGEDLDDVARLWEMSRDEVVATHTGTAFVVAFCGFAPGFAYCTGLPERLHVARRPSPRTRVPAGSVGLAGEFTGVYPTASPGGWQLIGVTDLTLFDVTAEPPALLAPGTRVRFTEVR